MGWYIPPNIRWYRWGDYAWYSLARRPTLVGEVDLLLTMEGWQKETVAADFPQARDKVCTLLGFVGKQGNVGDPINGSLDDYRACARQIMQAIQVLVDKFDRAGKLSQQA